MNSSASLRALIPRATLRLQFHRDFTFDDALVQVDYFAALGVSHLYASPIFTARSGSTHGYDVVDPGCINPELGGEEGLRRLVQALHERHMGLIVDIVPNHMALGDQNPWWGDVLLWGRHSHYASWFDIEWQGADAALHGKVLLPVLGKPYGDLLIAGEIKLERRPGASTLPVPAIACRWLLKTMSTYWARPLRRDWLKSLRHSGGCRKQPCRRSARPAPRRRGVRLNKLSKLRRCVPMSIPVWRVTPP